MAKVQKNRHPKGGDANHENSTRRFAPWTERCVVLQPDAPTAPCGDGCTQNHAHCILGVGTALVKAAADSLIGAESSRNVVEHRQESLLGRMGEASAR